MNQPRYYVESVLPKGAKFHMAMFDAVMVPFDYQTAMIYPTTVRRPFSSLNLETYGFAIEEIIYSIAYLHKDHLVTGRFKHIFNSFVARLNGPCLSTRTRDMFDIYDIKDVIKDSPVKGIPVIQFKD